MMKNVFKVLVMLVALYLVAKWDVGIDNISVVKSFIKNDIFHSVDKVVPKQEEKIKLPVNSYGYMDFYSGLKWRVAEASYYDPMDPAQTKSIPDGIGTSKRKILSGSVGMDSAFIRDVTDNFEKIVYIEIMNSERETPYGKGIFRVDDKMNSKFVGNHIDFYCKDLGPRLRQKGRFNVYFRIHHVESKKGS